MGSNRVHDTAEQPIPIPLTMTVRREKLVNGEGARRYGYYGPDHLNFRFFVLSWVFSPSVRGFLKLSFGQRAT